MSIHFEDRQAKYPNRWTMTKSDGTSEVVTLIRNDEPIVDGTPMNAETLNSLSDVAGADLARALAESARTEAQTAASNAASSASAAATSETNSAASEAAAKKSADSAAASAELAGTRAGTDKTLSIEDAPADAKKTGEELALRYTKEQVDALLAQYKADTLLAAYPVGSLYMSVDPTSPAELFGGTWEQIAQDLALMGSSTTHPAGSTAEAGLPNITGFAIFRPYNSVYKTGVVWRCTGAFYDKKDNVESSQSIATDDFGTNNQTLWFDASKSSPVYGNSSTVQPPAYFTNIWRRVE